MRSLGERRYREAFGGEAQRLVVEKSPGRVNIIGEHTDYNEGFILPMPIGMNVWICGKPRGDNQIHLYSSDYSERFVFEPHKLKFSHDHRWVNYVQGIVSAMSAKGYGIKGANMVIWGDIPQGAGLGSSGALEMAVIKGFARLFELDIPPLVMACIGKSAENDFVGVRSGIMDQLVSVLGREGEAMLIDCRTNDYDFIPMKSDIAVVAVDTGVKRELALSKYNERRAECEESVAILKKRLGINSLRDLDTEEFTRFKHLLPNNLQKRCKHVIFENERVIKAVEAIKDEDFQRLGSLMYESHLSLRDYYEVSCRELDLLVDLARKVKGAFGSRMMGAGFGGCTVNILERNRIEEFSQILKKRYKELTNLSAQVYICYTR